MHYTHVCTVHISKYNMHIYITPYQYSSLLYPTMGGMIHIHNLHLPNPKLLYTCAAHSTYLFNIYSIMYTQHTVHMCTNTHAVHPQVCVCRVL